MLRGEQKAAKSCYEVNCRQKKSREGEVTMMTTKKWPDESRDKGYMGAQATDELQDVCLKPGTEKVIKVGRDLGEVEKSRLVRFLQ